MEYDCIAGPDLDDLVRRLNELQEWELVTHSILPSLVYGRQPTHYLIIRRKKEKP